MVRAAARMGITAEVTRAQAPRHLGMLVCLCVCTQV